ncbi:MAG: calcium/sodium antiporter [Patescibacteria group bacterium]|nr:MAG: calcium/sodium antiporter [Patescibacteria group bacterium]
MMTYLLLLLGFIVLIKGAEFLVDGASSVAKKMRVSNLAIGLTIVAFGTSAPELFVNLFASFNGNADIAIGNIVGSNIVNTLLILGIVAMIMPIKVGKGTVWKEIPMALLAAVLLLVMANDAIVDRVAHNALTRSDGVALIAFFIIFLYYTFGIAKQVGTDEQPAPRVYSGLGSVARIVGGFAGLAVGGQWIVSSASVIASRFGMSDALIGLTIVAIGTSLPELSTSIVAAIKKNADIAVGNVIGSNIFNIFWILGISSIIRPLPFKPELNLDLWMVVVSSALLFIWMFLGKRHLLERWQGGAMILLYSAYTGAIILRG